MKPHGQGIQVAFTWRDRRWRPTLKLKPTPANLKYAARLVIEINERVRLGTFRFADYFPDARVKPESAPARKTFGDAAADWLKTVEVEETTRTSYRRALNYWLEGWRDTPLEAITATAVRLRIAELGLSPKTRNNALTPLRGIFSMALEDGGIPSDPTARIKNLLTQQEPPDPLELHEIDVVLAELEGQVRNYFEFAFFTGLRPSELIALAWSDVDEHRGTVTVRRARAMGVNKGTKTHATRDVELTARAAAALEAQKPHTRLAGAHVFHNPGTGRAWNSEKFQRLHWTRALTRAGLRYRVPYQTRHTFATQALMSGCNPMWVARQMGHATMKMLLDRYARWIDAADRSREKGKFDAAVATNVPQAARRGHGLP